MEVPKVISDRKELNKMTIKISDLFHMTRSVGGTWVLCRFVNTQKEK